MGVFEYGIFRVPVRHGLEGICLSSRERGTLGWAVGAAQ